MRLGSYEWVDNTGGLLTTAERVHLLRGVAGELVIYVAHRVRAAWWRRRPAGDVVALRAPPASELSQRAQSASTYLQSERLAQHSMRSWLFGRELARRDKADQRSDWDEELFYVATLLHDVGLDKPVRGECFTKRSADAAAEVAIEASVSPGDTSRLRDVITNHITPGLEIRKGDDVLSVYLQRGTSVDVIGSRVTNLEVELVRSVCSAFPRGSFGDAVSQLWIEESVSVPEGRADFANPLGLLVWAARNAPLPP